MHQRADTIVEGLSVRLYVQKKGAFNRVGQVTAWHLRRRLFQLSLRYLVHRVGSRSCALAAHDGGVSPVDYFFICQTFAASPAEPGGLLG